MTDREIINISELKIQIVQEQDGRCATCDMLMANVELAHRIPKTKANLRKWGPEVIHHRLNLRATHPGRCNSAQLINPATEPLKAQALVDEILEIINGDA